MKKAISVLLSVMLLITTISTALTFTVGASDPETEPVNLFTDGDFDALSPGSEITEGMTTTPDDTNVLVTPNDNGWTKSATWYNMLVKEYEDAHSGTNVLECGNKYHTFARTLAIKPNTDYKFSFWYYAPEQYKLDKIIILGRETAGDVAYNNNGEILRDGRTVLGAIAITESIVNNAWTQVTVVFNSGAFAMADFSIKGQDYGESGSIYIDDIELVEADYKGNLTNAKLDDMSGFSAGGASVTVAGFKGEISGTNAKAEAATADDLPEGIKDNNNVINISGENLNIQYYSTSTYKIKPGSSYKAYALVKTNNIKPLRFALFEKNYIEHTGTEATSEKPLEGKNIYSYGYWEVGSNTRPCRDDISYKYSVNGQPTENAGAGTGNASMFITRGGKNNDIMYDPSETYADGGWAMLAMEFTVPDKETWENGGRFDMVLESLPYEADVSLGIWTSNNSGESSISIAAMEIEEVITPEIAVNSGDSESELGVASSDKAVYSEGEEATFTATPYAGSTFDGWYKDGELYKSETTFTETITGPISLEARFSSDYDNLFPEAGFENIALGDYIRISGGAWQNGWSTAPGSMSWVTGKVVNTTAATGNNSLEVFGRHQMLEKTVTLEANTDYMFNFSYFLPSYEQDIAEHHFNCVQIVQPDAEYNTTAPNAYPNGTVIAIQHFGNDFAGEDSAPPIYNDQWVDNTVKFNTGDNTTVKIVLQYVSEWNDTANFIYYDNFQLFKVSDITPDAPTITLGSDPDVRDWYTTAPDITITPAEENGFGLKTYFKFYSTEEEEPTEGTLFDGTQPEIVEDGRYYVKAWTEDSYGNTSTVASKLIKVSATPPEYTPGDINDDGEVDDTDVMVLARYLAQWDMNEDEYVVDAMDTNGDSSVDDNDVAHLRRYLAHWEGIELN